MDDIMEFLDSLAEKGWLFSLETDVDQSVKISLCKPSWITSNLGQSVPLPTWKGKTVAGVVNKVKEYI